VHASAGRPSGLAWLSCVLPIGQSEWVTERGRFPEIPVCVWAKQKGGSWKAVHDIWNADTK